MKNIIFLLISFISISYSNDNCKSVFTNTDVLPSGRDSGFIGTLEKAAEELTNIAKELGYNTPDKKLFFGPSSEIANLVATGGYPSPHWYDGLKILQGQSSLGGVLEFVVGGANSTYSFYKDTTSLKEQISVIMHVIGHDDVSSQSMWSTIRGGDPIFASVKISNYMQELYRTLNHDEVSLFYQFLNSLTYFQDLTHGSFEAPEKFIPRSAGNKPVNKMGTPSALQSFIANFPPDTPEWKLNLAKLFEERSRIYGFYTTTKVMNEGWASFTQFLLTKHSQYRTSSDLIDFAGLMAGVLVPGFENPYWLGFQCWMRIWERFRERPEIASLSSEKEKDIAFVSHAHEIMRQTTDYEFVRTSLDETWVRKFKLHLKRNPTFEEMEESFRRNKGRDVFGKPINPEAPYEVVISKDANRIIDHIARTSADQKNKIPRIFLVDHNYRGKSLLLRHAVNENIPLEKYSAVQTMFLLSRLHNKQVILDTVGSIFTIADKSLYYFEGMEVVFPIRIIVDPDGSVQVLKLNRAQEQKEDEFVPMLDFSQELSLAVQAYKKDLKDSFYNEKFLNKEDERYKNLFTFLEKEFVKAAHLQLINHAPNASAAVSEFLDLLKRRTLKKIEEALKGNSNYQIGPKGVRLKILPTIPSFRLDSKTKKMLQQMKELAPIDNGEKKELQIGIDDLSNFGQGDYLPYDLVPKKPKQKGKGEGEGDPEDSDEEEGDDSSPGQDGKDPTMVEIPLNVWGELLGQNIELPNLRRTGGNSKVPDFERAGAISRDGEPINWDKTVEEVIRWGLSFENKGKEIARDAKSRVSRLKSLLREGFKTMPLEEYKVKPLQTIYEPDIKAVVVFVLDVSGSTQGRPHEVMKNFVYNLVALIKSKYEQVDVKFVIYDDKGMEIPESKVWTTYLGGGTSDDAGMETAGEILKKYPRGQWNRFVYQIADGGSFGTENLISEIRKLHAEVEHMAYIQNVVNPGFDVPSHIAAIEALAKELRWFDKVELGDGTELETLKALFEKKK